MDILIKNIDNLSKKCNECLRTYIAMNDGDKNLIGSLSVDCKTGFADCPLVALPSHGRLGDLDALIEHETYNIEQALFDSDEVLEDLKNTPVIVEASATTPSRNHTCPYTQGLCGLDENILCYCHSSYEMCDMYKEANNGTDH